MSYLADTNIVARWGLPSDPLYPAIRRAIFTLQAQREVIYITPQVLVEFHALATRPMELATSSPSMETTFGALPGLRW